MTQSTKQAAKLPAYLEALKSGFDLTARHWWLGILPFMVDMLLWLGPRLNYQVLGTQYLDFWMAQLDSAELNQPIPIDQFYTLLERSNLLSALSAPFFGLPILLGGLAQTETPLPTQTIYLTHWDEFGMNWMVLAFASMLLSAAYFSLIAQSVRDGALDLVDFGRNLLSNTFRLITLTIIAIIALFIILIPLTFVAGIAGLVNQSLTFVVLIGGSIVIMWGVILFSFTSQALFLQRVSPFRAVRTSFQVIRRHLNAVLPLLLAVVLITSVVDNLWLLVYDGSWLVLVSLAGHAFIATSLVTATFIFFQKLTTTAESDMAPTQ